MRTLAGTAGAVIDLDHQRVEMPEDEPGLLPRWSRWLGLAVAALLSGTALVAAAPLPGPRLVEVAQIDRASVVTMRVAGSMLFAVMLGSGLNLVGYRLADGARQWSVPLAANGTDTQADGIDVVDGAVLVSVIGAQGSARTVAVDATTGQELWRSDLPQVLSVGSTILLRASLNPDNTLGAPVFPGPSDSPQPVLLHAVDARTGRLVWAYQVPAGWRTILPIAAVGADPASVFAVISPSGQAITIDLATGAVRASAAIDAAASNQNADLGRVTGVYGDQLLLVTGGQDRPTLAAYRANTLGLQWTAPLPVPAGFAGRCGPWLCLGDESGTHAFARDTGKPAWNVAGLNGWVAGWLYDAAANDPNQSGDITLIDPTTQRVVLNLGRWRISAISSDGSVVMAQVERDSARTWFGLLAAGPRVDTLGAATALTPITCQADNGYLACLTRSHQVRIWRYRR